jgi:hypothetical protein
VGGKGIGNFAEAWAMRERQQGKRFQPVVMRGLRGKPCAAKKPKKKKALLLLLLRQK